MITRHQKANWKSYCSEPLELVENYMAAEADGFEGWCMHHKLEIQPDGTRVSAQELNDQGLYYDRPANELVFMKVGEHMSLHNKDMQLSAEHRKKMSALHKGSIFWNDGVSCKRSRECPGEGWKRGRLKASISNCKT